MRIERICVDGFGRLRDLDTGTESLGNLVVVLGPNEAGKSTLFSFLTTSLYGFSPASRDTNPHVPWGSSEAGGRIHVSTSDEASLVVERRLRSSPAGTLMRGEGRLDLRNQPLDLVHHVPRTVFRQVFAVTLAELAGLDDETWSRIQDRILGSMGASDLASARDVAEQLEQEASEIWRPNRRGNQRLRDLRDEMRALRSRRSEAIARDRDIRALTEDRESVTLRLDDVRRGLKRDRIVVERVQDLLPLKRQLDRVVALRLEGGSRAELDGLPEDLTVRLDTIDEEVTELQGRLEAIDEDLVEPKRTVAAFDSSAQTLLGHATAVDEFLRGPDASRALAVQLDDLRIETDGARFEMEAIERQLFDDSPTEEIRSRVLTISTDLLRDRVGRLSALHRPEGVPTPANVSRPLTVPGWVPGLLVIVGAGILAWGLLSGSSVTAGLGAALLAGGLFFARSGGHAPSANVPDDGGAARLESEISAALDGLGVRAEYLTPPGLPIVSAVERLQKHVAHWDTLARSSKALTLRLDNRAAAAAALGTKLGYPAPDDLSAFEASVESRVQEARRLHDAATQAAGEHERLLHTRHRIVTDVDRLQEERAAFLERVGDLGRGASAGAIDHVQRRLDAHERADRIEEELERTHLDIADRKARIADVEASEKSWSVSEDEVADRRIRMEEAETHLEELVGRSRALEKDVAHLRDQETVDAIDGELQALREVESRMVTERDRKWILAQLVREADRRFREEHQPDLLRRASTYLQRLTDGRYERLLVDERADGDLFHLVSPALPRPVPLAPPISTGTLEQAYLALRLAIVDHLDRDGERLPLFLDEVFVNWDEARCEQGLSVLAEVSQKRQVFAFTCHPEMAARLEDRGGRLVRLDR